jgi:uncharacterized protein YxjI
MLNKNAGKECSDVPFSIIDETGHPLALIGHQNSMFPDCYAIEVVQDVDAVVMVALVIVIDMVRERKEQASSY